MSGIYGVPSFLRQRFMKETSRNWKLPRCAILSHSEEPWSGTLKNHGFQHCQTKISPLKYPKWEAPPPPDILNDITNVQLEDHGSYLVVPSELDPEDDSVLTVMCFSDTHTKHKEWRMDQLPPADLLLHAGDFTFSGNKSEVMGFEEWGAFMARVSCDEQKNEEIYKRYYGVGDAENGEEAKSMEVIDDDLLPMDERKYKHLVCIAGNHDMTFDTKWYTQNPSARRYVLCSLDWNHFHHKS